MRPWLTCLAAAACALATNGCFAGRYLADRGADLADVFVAEVGVGPGLEAHAQLTGYLGAGVGRSQLSVLLLHGRDVGTARRSSSGLLWTAATQVDYGRVRSLHGARKHSGRQTRAWRYLLPDSSFSSSRRYRPRWPDNFNVEVGAAYFIVGAHVGINPVELVDLLLGIVTIDIVGDD